MGWNGSLGACHRRSWQSHTRPGASFGASTHCPVDPASLLAASASTGMPQLTMATSRISLSCGPCLPTGAPGHGRAPRALLLGRARHDSDVHGAEALARYARGKRYAASQRARGGEEGEPGCRAAGGAQGDGAVREGGTGMGCTAMYNQCVFISANPRSALSSSHRQDSAIGDEAGCRRC